LLEIVDKIKEIRTEQFEKRLREAFTDKKIRVRDFMSEEFGKYSRVLGNDLLFTEIGIMMERLGHLLNAQHFYNWVQQQTDDAEFRREMAIRWIVCRERQAYMTENPDDYLPEAIEKREELEITVDTELPEEPHFDKWQSLFKTVLNESGAKKRVSKPTPNTPSPAQDVSSAVTMQNSPSNGVNALSPDGVNDLPDSIKGSDILKNPFNPAPPDAAPPNIGQRTSNASSPHQAAVDKPKSSRRGTRGSSAAKTDAWVKQIDFEGYLFEYNSAKSTLVISYEPERLSVKIKHGQFPVGGEFIVENDRLMKIDDDGNKTQTPFRCTMDGKQLEFQIIQNGKKIAFPIE
jgi:hypothetical protein